MMFFNPFAQFNYSPMMTGFCFGNGLTQALFSSSSFWYTPNFVQGFGFGVPLIFSGNPGFYGPFQNSVFPCFNVYDTGFNMFDSFNSSFALKQNAANNGLNYSKNYTYTMNDYDSKKGELLANDIKKYAKGSKSQCARYVSNALVRTGLSDGMARGDAYQMSSLLRNNRNFTEVSPSDTNWKNLPAGCILCYNKCSQGYSCEWGHIEVTLGDGTAASDYINSDIKKPDTIFIPV